MKLIFAGTPAFAAVALDGLLAAGHQLQLVLTQPDKPAGRGMQLRTSAVKEYALKHALALAQPPSLRDPRVVEQLRALNPECMVVAAYGLILPPEVLDVPARGALNIHASLLPRWRGAAPIQRALLAGDKFTGITIMQMDAGLDTGAILLQETLSIAEDDTALTLHDQLAHLGASAIVRALREHPVPHPQNDAEATYAHKISKPEAVLDWTRSAVELSRQVRAYNPVPGASSTLAGVQHKIWRGRPVNAQGAPGTILQAGPDAIVVASGSGALSIEELQKAGAKRMPAAAYLAGGAVHAGMRFGI